MLDVITSKKIEPFYAIKLGSSSTDGEDRDLLNLDYFMKKDFYTVGLNLAFDIASYFKNVFPILENETYKFKEIIPEEMIEHDIFIKMSPKRRRTVKFKIKRIRKAKPRIIIPENPYTDI